MNNKTKHLVNNIKLKLEELNTLKNKCMDDTPNNIALFTHIEDKINYFKSKLSYQFDILDYKLNKVEYKIANLYLKHDNFLKLSDKNYYLELSENICLKNKEFNELEKEITKLSKEKTSVRYLKFKTNVIKKEIKVFEKALTNNDQEIILKCKQEIIKIKEKIRILEDNSNVLKNEINELLFLAETCEQELSFLHTDINKNSSVFTIKNLSVWYDKKNALSNISMTIPKNKITAIIGPSGCGKSTLLKTLNKILDNNENIKIQGDIIYDNKYLLSTLTSITDKYDKLDLSTLRSKVGMIFQSPNPFHMSIERNVQYGPRVKGIKDVSQLTHITKMSLLEVGLWEEVKDDLKILGTSLSGGQQQRLCIARTIANEPNVILMDEPTSALDPIAAKKVENLIIKLRKYYTIIIVTHSMQQAKRLSDKTAFIYQGKLIEYKSTLKLFNNPSNLKTKAYINGEFG